MIAESLGDIKKCFGNKAYEDAVLSLNNSGISFVYFTSNEMSWGGGS
jgi:hypothetical protein